MIYCEPCRDRRNWPAKPVGLGTCERCGDTAPVCHNVPYRALTGIEEPQGKTKPANGDQLAALLEYVEEATQCMGVADDNDNSYHCNDSGSCLEELKEAFKNYMDSRK